MNSGLRDPMNSIPSAPRLSDDRVKVIVTWEDGRSIQTYLTTLKALSYVYSMLSRSEYPDGLGNPRMIKQIEISWDE